MRLFGKRKVSLNAAPPLLQTPRLVLRGFDPSDAVDVLARARGEAAGAMASAPPCQSHEESRRTVEGFIRGGSTWAVVEKRSGHVIGAVALVCIGGLLYATLMTLLVVPCMYDILSRRELRKVEETDLQTLDM